MRCAHHGPAIERNGPHSGPYGVWDWGEVIITPDVITWQETEP